MVCSALTQVGLGTFLWLFCNLAVFLVLTREKGTPFPNVNMFVVVSICYAVGQLCV